MDKHSFYNQPDLRRLLAEQSDKNNLIALEEMFIAISDKMFLRREVRGFVDADGIDDAAEFAILYTLNPNSAGSEVEELWQSEKAIEFADWHQAVSILLEGYPTEQAAITRRLV